MKKRCMKFSDMITDPALGYCDFNRITAKHSKSGIPFFIYILEKQLTDEKKTELLNKYNNIIFLTRTWIYAPEQKHDGIAVFDKKIIKGD